MVSKSALMFLEKQVDFYFIDDFPRNKFKEENLNIFKNQALHKTIAFVWAKTLSEILIEKVGNAEYEQVVIVTSDDSFNLRRAEVLLGTRIKRVYLYNGAEFNYDDIFIVCTEFSEQKNSEKSGIEGIKRVLNLNSQKKNDSVFSCIFNNNCLIESPKNVNVACLQLKGQRASAIFVENAENETFGAISKILPKSQNNQVLLNLDKLSEENKKFLKSSGLEFQNVSASDGGDLITVLNKVDLPLLSERVWDKNNYLKTLKLKKLLSDISISGHFITISGDISDKVATELEIVNEIELSTGYQNKREGSLIFYKTQILKKKIILLNHKNPVIQQDLLRMLLTAGNNKYTLIAIGTDKDYEQLINLHGEMMEKNFYQSRDLYFKIMNIKELISFFEKIVKGKPSEIEKAKVLKDISDKDILVRKKLLMQLEKQFRVSFSKFIGSVITDFMQLSSIVVISDKESGKIITDAILKQYGKNDEIENVFRNKEEKNKFHKFLRSITPESSKTEFPENTGELILIIKALIYKILGSFFNDSGDVSFITKKIDEIKLTINPFESMTAKLKKLVQFNNHMVQEEHDTDFIKYLYALKKKSVELENILSELVLQFNFVLLAVPSEMVIKKYFTSEEIADKSKRIKKSPFKDLDLIIKEIEFLMKKYK